MNDLIRKAVELADGWEHNKQGDIYGPFGPIGYGLTIDLSQEELDALAAQLVRQVDATDYEIRMQSCATTIFHGGEEFWWVGENPVGTLQKLKDTEKQLEQQTALTNYWRGYVDNPEKREELEEIIHARAQTSKSRKSNV